MSLNKEEIKKQINETINEINWDNDKVQKLIDLCLYRQEMQTKRFIEQKINKILNQFED